MKKRTNFFTGDYLAPLKTTLKTKRHMFGTVDIESKAGDTQDAGFTRPFLTGFYDPQADEFLHFRDEPHLEVLNWETRHMRPGGCVDKLMNYLLVKEYNNWSFFAHYGGNFDFLHFLHWLQQHRDEFDFEVTPVQSSIQVLTVWDVPDDPEDKPKYKWTFLDSMKLVPMSLSEACRAFGVPGKESMNLSCHEKHKDWVPYLEQDCRALFSVMMRLYEMIEDRLGGEVGITTPSTSIKLFRRRFQGNHGCPEKIERYSHFPSCKGKATKQKPATCEGCQHEWIRHGYYGGRTEIFRTFGEDLHYYDFNSSYVASMKEDVPIGKRVIEEGKIIWKRHRSEDNPNGRYSGFAEVTVYIPHDCEIPPLPHRDIKTKKLVFPTGRFSGVWSIEELKLLEHPLVNGTIEKVGKVIWFGLKPMFREMVNTLWQFRNKALATWEEAMDTLAKLLGNGTYGKFAMKKERMSIVFCKDSEEIIRLNKKDDCDHCFLCGEKAEIDSQICLSCTGSRPATNEFGEIWYKANKVDAMYIIPHVSAHITASARVRLWHAMALVIQSGGKLFYLDTDSLITDIELPSSKALGALKDEHPGERIRFLAVQPKVYMIELMNLNEEIDKRQEWLRRAKAGDDSIDCSTLDSYKVDPKAMTCEGEAFNGGVLPHPRKVALTRYNKVTMKGFPRDQRTEENLQKLRDGQQLEWKQLEKVRSIARQGFRRPPQMRKVKKSFKSTYDKRVRLDPTDLDGATVSIVLGLDIPEGDPEYWAPPLLAQFHEEDAP